MQMQRTTKVLNQIRFFTRHEIALHADDSVLGEYDTLVVNAGQHRSLGGMEEYGEMMRNASAFLTPAMERLHGDDAILVVRNTVPGHGGNYDR